jgi:hypothetical protein
MSKKTFSQGLDDLFNDTAPERDRWPGGDMTAAAAAPERRTAAKNFMADLDALLQDALEEGLDSLEAAPPAAAPFGGKTKATAQRAPLSGLDALIRQTVDVREVAADEATGKKRLTVAVDKTKLEKLKTIARLENSYLKDVLLEVIDRYIEEYRQQKGLEL